MSGTAAVEAPYLVDFARDLAGDAMAAEDKYLDELFPQFERHIALPPPLVELLPFWLKPDYDWEDNGSDPGVREREALRIAAGFNAAVEALEHAFTQAGLSLATFELRGGDHLHFVALKPAVATRWSGIVLARTARGEPLGLRPPDWPAFSAHLSYCLHLGELRDVRSTRFDLREPVRG